MELLGKISLWIHILAGVVTLIAGPLAIFYNFRNVRNHRRAGKVFFYAMLVICFTSVGGYLKHPDAVFFQFLLGIAVIVLVGILTGVRAMRFMQGAALGKYDYAYTALLGICAVWMLGQAGWHYLRGTMIAFPVLFAVFGLSAVGDTLKSLRLFRRSASVERTAWYRLHVGSMLGAFTASTTAFTVNAAPFLPWFVQWFGPTLLILPLQIYFGRKVRGKKQQTVTV